MTCQESISRHTKPTLENVLNEQLEVQSNNEHDHMVGLKKLMKELKSELTVICICVKASIAIILSFKFPH